MTTRRAVVIGASGLIGFHLLRVGQARGWYVAGTTFRQQVPDLIPLDITNPTALRAFGQEQRPDVIFLPAAVPNVDLCETDPAGTRRVNVEPLGDLVDMAANLSALVVFYSTDYLFDGAAGPYSEDDPPNPINEYGRQKLDAEAIIRAALPGDHLILRVTVVYGWERQGKNFITRLVRTLRDGEAMRVPNDQLGTPTLVDDLAEASWEMVEHGARGTFNVVGPEVIDRYTFAVRAAQAFGLNSALLSPVETRELGQTAPRPLSAGLRPDKAEKVLQRQLLGPEAGLSRLTQEYSL